MNLKLTTIIIVTLFSLTYCSKENDLPPNPHYQPGGLDYSQVITLKINQILNNQGNMLIALYNNSSTWSADMDSHLSDNMYNYIETPAISGSIICQFDSIPNGIYAISLLQDQNKNNNMDMGGLFNMFPQEPYGFSNNIVPSTSAPSFSSCSFNVNEGDSIYIEINLLQP